MKLQLSIVSVALIAGGLLPSAVGQNNLVVYTVPATANIYAAGLDTPIAPGGGGGGTLPIQISVAGRTTAYQFSASGSISQYYDEYYHGPDGLPNWSATVYAYGGLSGFVTGQLLPLAGVYLTDSAPQAPAPQTLDFTGSGLGLDFLTLSPAIGQVFFIGDGVTSGSVTQTFYVPAGATRLFLGCPDSVNSLGYPGAYDDNWGSLAVTATPVPEPTVGALVAIALAGCVAGRRRTTTQT